MLGLAARHPGDRVVGSRIRLRAGRGGRARGLRPAALPSRRRLDNARHRSVGPLGGRCWSLAVRRPPPDGQEPAATRVALCGRGLRWRIGLLPMAVGHGSRRAAWCPGHDRGFRALGVGVLVQRSRERLCDRLGLRPMAYEFPLFHSSMALGLIAVAIRVSLSVNQGAGVERLRVAASVAIDASALDAQGLSAGRVAARQPGIPGLRRRFGCSPRRWCRSPRSGWRGCRWAWSSGWWSMPSGLTSGRSAHGSGSATRPISASSGPGSAGLFAPGIDAGDRAGAVADGDRLIRGPGTRGIRSPPAGLVDDDGDAGTSRPDISSLPDRTSGLDRHRADRACCAVCTRSALLALWWLGVRAIAASFRLLPPAVDYYPIATAIAALGRGSARPAYAAEPES